MHVLTRVRASHEDTHWCGLTTTSSRVPAPTSSTARVHTNPATWLTRNIEGSALGLSESAMPNSEASDRAEARRDRRRRRWSPLLVFVVLAIVSWSRTGSSSAQHGGSGSSSRYITARGRPVDDFSRSGNRPVAECGAPTLALLALGNFAAVVILVAGLVTASASDLTGGELLFTGFAIWSADVIVFGLWFWEVDAAVRDSSARSYTTSGLSFCNEESKAAEGWRPQVWDYLYVSLTNSIAFSPTDTMPLSLRAKAMMGFESGISAVTVLLIAARAVNVLGS